MLSADFIFIFSEKFFLEPSGLIWIQIICKSYEQTTWQRVNVNLKVQDLGKFELTFMFCDPSLHSYLDMLAL